VSRYCSSVTFSKPVHHYSAELLLQRDVMDGLDATSTAYAVGYESVSQFSREYSRFFDQPPIRDINVLRDSNVAQANVAAKIVLGLPAKLVFINSHLVTLHPVARPSGS
jgi:hypothetical protein